MCFETLKTLPKKALRTERKRASQISPGRLADTGAIDPRPWEHSVTQLPASPCDVDELVVGRAAPAGHGRSHFGSSATQLQGQEHNPQPNVSLTGQPHSSLLSLILASIFVSEDRVRRVRERRAVAGLSVFHARKLSILKYLSSEPSDQGEITSVVAKRKSNERSSKLLNTR